jgi:hypothetical protein
VKVKVSRRQPAAPCPSPWSRRGGSRGLLTAHSHVLLILAVSPFSYPLIRRLVAAGEVEAVDAVARSPRDAGQHASTATASLPSPAATASSPTATASSPAATLSSPAASSPSLPPTASPAVWAAFPPVEDAAEVSRVSHSLASSQTRSRDSTQGCWEAFCGTSRGSASAGFG